MHASRLSVAYFVSFAWSLRALLSRLALFLTVIFLVSKPFWIRSRIFSDFEFLKDQDRRFSYTASHTYIPNFFWVIGMGWV